MPANLVEGQDADDIAVYIAKCSGNAHCGVTAARSSAAPGGGTTTTAQGGGGGEARRQGDLRLGGLRQLPHAEGRGARAATSARTSTS